MSFSSGPSGTLREIRALEDNQSKIEKVLLNLRGELYECGQKDNNDVVARNLRVEIARLEAMIRDIQDQINQTRDTHNRALISVKLTETKLFGNGGILE